MSLTSRIIGFQGLGAMGGAMALNLQNFLAASGAPPLRVTNRTISKTQPVVDAGAISVPSLSEIVGTHGADVVFSVTFDDASVIQAVEEISKTEGRKKDLIFVSHATINPKTATRAAGIAESAGFKYLACPVFGRPDAAAAKRILCVLAGDDGAKAVVAPYLEAIGRGIQDAGSQPHLANVVKLGGNYMLAANLQILGETMAMMDQNGVSREDFVKLVNFIHGPILAGYGTRIAGNEYQINSEKPGFAVEGGLKDVGLAKALADDSGVHLSTATDLKESLNHLVETGRKDYDWGSVALVIGEKAGVKT
ncbi:hypothetical protein BJ742DRAFT_755881 [Cladochytrium replicatum]|nr:hypothetical protein BJ742DRAFT_755881 [Cladochytrium replicatum]